MPTYTDQHCTAGQKFTMVYSFSGRPSEEISTTNTPVTVQKIFPGTDTSNPGGGRLSFVDQFGTSRIADRITEYYLGAPYGTGIYRGMPSLWYSTCTMSGYRFGFVRYVSGYDTTIGRCPGVPNDVVYLYVYDKNGNLIRSDAGYAPLNVQVVCEAGCPEGTLNCDGCCADCKEINFKLQILNQLINRMK
jgi:hypothetical protein